MPDKPKRRKNNKNKRKNKNNNRNNVNKNNSDVNDTSSVNSCDYQDENIDDGCESNQSELYNESEIKIVEPIIENTYTSQDSPVNILTDVQSLKLDRESESKSDKKEFLCLPNTADILKPEVSIDTPTSYVVETPDVKKKSHSKLNSNMKSKSVDNDEFPIIVEITEETNIQPESEKSLAIIDNSNIIITDAESDVEWEKTDDLHEITQQEDLSAEASSVTTIPLEIAQCEQTKSLSAEQEESLRCYLQSLDLATSPSNLSSSQIRTEIEQIINREIKHRLRKKGLTEDMFFQRGNISRGLDVIDEEGSSESSATSRRHSYLSDKKSDNDDLEDEVFENKSNIAFKPSVFSNIQSRKVIPQQCILVDAKLKEPDVSEARGNWSIKTMEKITGAEVVYLTDSSSSTSSLYDVSDDIENDEVSDASIRIITPTIEVTDTEKFLTNTFISKDNQSLQEEHRQNTNNKEISIKELNKVVNDQKLQENVVNIIQDPHEIVVLSTDNVTTNLIVKDINPKPTTEPDVKPTVIIDREADKENTETEIKINDQNLQDTSKNDLNAYDLEIKVLKCELNDAINNLIKEVTSDSESTSDNHKNTYARQDSSSSVCSSQCTAKYNPNYSSLTDVSNIMHEDTSTTTDEKNKEDSQVTDITSHVKDVFQYVTGDSTSNKNKGNNNKKDPFALKDLCVQKIASFPFGSKILEELAHVSERLQNMSLLALESKDASELIREKLIEKPNNGKPPSKMPYYPLPDISNIEKISLSTRNSEHVPPPVKPRKSSLIKSQDEQHWTAIPSATEPVYVCLSPSQKMLMEKTNTLIRKEDASKLIDTHKKYVDRRGYDEKSNENIDTTPIVPFKSQTGSRLLALIRDPSVTNNISLSSNQNNIYKSLESIPKLNYFDNKQCSEVNKTTNNSTKFSKSFKPIPPPRPRKFSSSFYESDESSDFTDNSFRSMRSEKKLFHYSTGNLNKEIENDISSIQNMHRYYSNMRDAHTKPEYPRRPSLPKDLCDQQMEYIRRKEKEVEEEIRRLEQEKINYPERKGPRAPLILDRPQMETTAYDSSNTKTTQKGHIFSNTKTRKEDKGRLSSVFSKSQEELLREKMYSEYVTQMAEREQRRQQKFIKITHTPASTSFKTMSKSMPKLDDLESKVNNRIEKEFICRARERWHKLGIEDPETEDEQEISNDIYREPKVIEHKIKVIQAGEEKDVTKLPSHLQDFVNFTARTKEQDDGRNGESEPGREPAHVVVFCAVIILVLAVGKFVWRLLRNKY